MDAKRWLFFGRRFDRGKSLARVGAKDAQLSKGFEPSACRILHTRKAAFWASGQCQVLDNVDKITLQ